MKKRIALVLTIVIALGSFAFAGCSKGESANTPGKLMENYFKDLKAGNYDKLYDYIVLETSGTPLLSREAYAEYVKNNISRTIKEFNVEWDRDDDELIRQYYDVRVSYTCEESVAPQTKTYEVVTYDGSWKINETREIKNDYRIILPYGTDKVTVDGIETIDGELEKYRGYYVAWLPGVFGKNHNVTFENASYETNGTGIVEGAVCLEGMASYLQYKDVEIETDYKVKEELKQSLLDENTRLFNSLHEHKDVIHRIANYSNRKGDNFIERNQWMIHEFDSVEVKSTEITNGYDYSVNGENDYRGLLFVKTVFSVHYTPGEEGWDYISTVCWVFNGEKFIPQQDLFEGGK